MTTSFVYFIRQGVTGPVKIGVAKDVVKRVRQLQTNQAVPLRIIRVLEGAGPLEKDLHSRFSHLRLKGEWFTFDPDMVKGDLGAVDAPIPMLRRNHPTPPDTPWGWERSLHAEILIAIGGAETLARRMRLPPWEVSPHNIAQKYWSATVLLLNDAGRHDITLDTLFEARRLVEEESRKITDERALAERKRLSDFDAKRERDWIAKHGAAAAWWPLQDTGEAEVAA